ncbi:hypothetical protein RIR_jg29040.t1 [Rhizophagus irregularis DAOM 181602=DAOM 197198]|nr:hypothetical protein RIR_jg29040.t1 [Rhizophagus irregularis DAOM 181602=DAOM 197198]
MNPIVTKPVIIITSEATENPVQPKGLEDFKMSNKAVLGVLNQGQILRRQGGYVAIEMVTISEIKRLGLTVYY